MRGIFVFGTVAMLWGTGAVAEPWDGLRPDPRTTPGAIEPFATVEQICTPGYSKSVRNVPTQVKNLVYREYAIPFHGAHEFEIDHLVSLELGGSNDVSNLWPQSYLTSPWNAYVKDSLENQLHRMVCDREISLAEAQHAIATDWIAAYQRYIGAVPEEHHKRRRR